MRMFCLAVLFCAACSSKPVSGPSEQTANATPTQTGAAQMEYYKRRTARSGEVLVPPILLRLSGTLAQKNGCLVLTKSYGSGDHALVFEEGKASFDPIKGVLTVGSARIAIGEPISVGGPFNQAYDDFKPSNVKKRCGVDAVWLVTGSDVKSFP